TTLLHCSFSVRTNAAAFSSVIPIGSQPVPKNPLRPQPAYSSHEIDAEPTSNVTRGSLGTRSQLPNAMTQPRATSSLASGHSATRAHPARSLLELNAGGLDHLAPALGLLTHELGRSRGRSADRLRGQIRKPLGDVGLAQGFIDVSVDLRGDRLRRIRLRHDRKPGRRYEPWQRLGDRRNLRQRGHALLGSNRDQFQLAALYQCKRHAEIIEHDVDVAGDEPLQGGSGAAIRHV